jgi:hypothetical protein
MAQTRRRRTKHRGNAAGVVEARGRTGRKPTAAEKDPKAKKATTARERREARLDKPPTWKGALNRALVATVLMMALFLFAVPHKGSSIGFIALVPIVLLIYTPMGYYTDLFIYRRRQRKKAASSP